MKSKLKFTLPLLFVFIVFLQHCKPDEYVGSYGGIYGMVNGRLLYSQGKKEKTEYRSFKITLEGSNPLVTAETDSLGNFKIGKIKPGTYNVVVSKTGYATQKQNGIQVLSDDSFRWVGYYSLKNQVKNTINSISFVKLDTTVMHYTNSCKLTLSSNITAKDTSVGDNFAVYFYFHNKADVSYKDYVYSQKIDYWYVNINSFQLKIPTKIFPSKTKVYVAAYLGNTDDYRNNFQDMETGCTVNGNINSDNPSNIISFVIPNP